MMTNMASKRNIKATVSRLIKGKKIIVPALSSDEKEELKERIRFAISQVQSGKA